LISNSNSWRIHVETIHILIKFFSLTNHFEKRAGAGTTYQKPKAAPTRIRETNRKWSTPVVVVKKSLEMVRGELEENFRKMKRERRSEVFFLL